jgi:hypothetical protein
MITIKDAILCEFMNRKKAEESQHSFGYKNVFSSHSLMIEIIIK